MRVLISCAILLLAPSIVFADKVAIAPVSYRLVWKDAESETKAKLVEEQAAAAAVEAGMEPVGGDAVKRAVAKALGSEGRCVSSDCLAKVAAEVGAKQAVFVSVEESGAQHKITVALARGDGTVGEIFGEMQVMLKGVRGLVKEALESKTEQAAGPAAEPEAKSEPIEQPRPVAEPEPKKPEPLANDKLSPLAFYITAGSTVAVAAVAIVLDAVVADRWDRLDKGEENSDYWDKSKKLQTADRVAIGFACAGVVATGVLFFFTDFDNDESGEKAAVSVGFGAVPGSAGAVVKGTF